MSISDLTETQRNQLIDIIPVVYEGTNNTIGRVLKKIRDGEKIDDNDKELIKKWDVAPKVSFPEIISSFITSFTFCTVFIKFTNQTS